MYSRLVYHHYKLVPGVIAGMTYNSSIDVVQALAIGFGGVFHECVTVRQVHGTVIHTVTPGAGGMVGDGLVSNITGTLIAVSLADCCGILCASSDGKAIGIAHSGWRGTAGEIGETLLRSMMKQFNLHVGQLRVVLSAAAGPSLYRVHSDVEGLFPNSVKQLSPDEFLYDNRAEIIRRLTMLGVSPNHITMDTADTISDLRFSSYRRSGLNAGRCHAFIGIP